MSDPLFVFDKDGVIVDTEAIKVRIYEEMLADEYPTKIPEIQDYANRTIGKTRLDRFTYIFEKIIGMDASKARKQAQNYVDRSLDIYQPILAEANLVPGIKDFFQSTPNLKFVCSAAHKTEVDDHLYGHQLTAYLQDWYSTTDKAEVLSMLKRKFKTEVIFWGDTFGDYEAAQKAEVPFIAVVLPHVTRDFSSLGVPTIKDFSKKKKLLSLIDKLMFDR